MAALNRTCRQFLSSRRLAVALIAAVAALRSLGHSGPARGADSPKVATWAIAHPVAEAIASPSACTGRLLAALPRLGCAARCMHDGLCVRADPPSDPLVRSLRRARDAMVERLAKRRSRRFRSSQHATPDALMSAGGITARPTAGFE